MMLLRDVISLLTSYSPVFKKTTHNTDHKIYCLAGYDICSAFFGIGKKSVFKYMIQGALKFQGLKDLVHGPLSNCIKLTCTQFVGVIYGKIDPTSLNKVSRAKAAT